MVTAQKQFEASQWNSPMLLIFSTSPEDRIYRMQREQIDAIGLALEDHHLIIAEIFENDSGHIGPVELTGDRCREFRMQFHVPTGQFKVVLLGRNSVTHLCSNDCISWQELIVRMDEVSEYQIPAVL